MRILFIHPHHIDYPGGAEKWVVEVVKKLKNKGHEIGVLYVNYMPHKKHTSNSYILKECGAELYTCRYVKLPRGFPIIDLRCLLKHVRDYDIAYVLAYPPNELLFRMVRRYTNASLIAGFHSSLEPHRVLLHKLYMPLYVNAYRVFDALHVLSESLHTVFVRFYGIHASKVYLIPNGIDASKYFIKRDDEKFRVLWTGRLYPEKGADILYKIILKSNRKYPYLTNEIEFIVTGTGPYERHIHVLSKLFNNVKYLGYVDEDTLRELYSRSHLYLVPSRSEGMPLRVLEASCSGLPVVGSRIPGIIDIVKTVGHGHLARAGDTDGYIVGILEFYRLWKENPNYYFELRNKIREIAMATYDWSNVIRKIEKMFLEVAYRKTRCNGRRHR